ncbi:hypothetical protein A1356_21020 [Methylomonas koyamae]|uniref:Uncharacterized protein n=1 Tax=Methylomonas koyamae TaxID=702114 RepID=A0AA91D8B9_9GAMM|nr:hypothetical protein A1356_21020 [Methylomonas koyamae]
MLSQNLSFSSSTGFTAVFQVFGFVLFQHYDAGNSNRSNNSNYGKGIVFFLFSHFLILILLL